jgi:hypothetical protein
MIEQFFIAATELIAMYLMQSNKYSDRKYSSIFGLLGQPFWFYASYTHEQWGSLFIGFFFTALWIRNFKMYWIDSTQLKLKPKEYHLLIMSAIDELKTSKLDKKDYIDRVLKEALNIK